MSRDITASDRAPTRRDGFVAAVEAIYDAAAVPERWPQALQEIADSFGDVGAIMIYEREDGGVGSICSPGLEAAQRDYDAGEWWRQDIRFSRSVERGAIARHDAVTDRDIASAEEMRTCRSTRSFCAVTGWAGSVASASRPIRACPSPCRSNARARSTPGRRRSSTA